MRVLLLDEEQLALDGFEELLFKISDDIEVVGKYRDPLQAKERVLAGDVDIVFLEIHIPYLSGLDLAEQLLESRPGLQIVFVTAHQQYALKAFELNAADYLLKPVDEERLKKTLQRVRDASNGSGTVEIAENIPLHMTLLKEIQFGFTKYESAAMEWKTSRAFELFLYLLHRKGQWLHKSELSELLWPEHEPGRMYSQLYTAVYHIRKTLERFGEYFQLRCKSGGYVLDLRNVQLDVEEWEAVVQSGLPMTSETISIYKETMRLYRGDYLQDYDYWWAESERHRLRSIWLGVSFRMAEWHLESGDTGEAIPLYLEICEYCPQAEEAYFALMKIFASQGNSLSVNRQYRLLETVLQEELNERPSSYVTEWYREWKSRERG